VETLGLIQTFDLILDDAAAIIHNQQVLAGIYTQLDKTALFPHEQQYIYSEHYGEMPFEPRTHYLSSVILS
jgi:hypothetical protein